MMLELVLSACLWLVVRQDLSVTLSNEVGLVIAHLTAVLLGR